MMPLDAAGRNVLITGGLGMIGSTIARRLVSQGARVTLLDACIKPYGSNTFNIEDIRDRVDVNIADIRDPEAMKILVAGRDIIFNLAGQVSHNDSMESPFLDAEINYLGHLRVLESVRRYNPEAVVLHAGSRLQYGRIQTLPVREDHPLNPRTPYALNKAAAENMYRFFAEVHGLRCVMLRISNPYGPRSQMKHSKYSMVNWFIRQAMEDKEVRIFGEGSQVRDYIYVDDLADAFIAAALSEPAWGGIFNVGSGQGTSFNEMVQAVVAAVGHGQVKHVPWPEDYVNVETGDYVADISRLCEMTDWAPGISFAEGVPRTVEFYQAHRDHYFNGS